jgi:ER-bound oxygenase mpaB/B'/Rubber oxygenase, catalytic domain
VRRPVLREIESLDPESDYERICFLTINYDFPWDTEQAESLAFFKTYCVPSISALLDRTGEFAGRGQKRYDDTKLILAELLDHGIDSAHGREAQRRMNRMHHRYAISNDDYLYVLSTLVLEPARWNQRFGWRSVTEKEKQAALNYWRDVGRRMGIHGIPTDHKELDAFNRRYEREHFRFAESNRRVADATMAVFVSWYPRPLRGVVRLVLLSLLEDRVLEAFGYQPPPAWLKAAVVGALRLRRRLLAYAPRRRRPHLITRSRQRTYPRGYAVEELGVQT